MSVQLELPVRLSALGPPVDVIRDLSDYGDPHAVAVSRPQVSAPVTRRPRTVEAPRERRELRRAAARRVVRAAITREERAKLSPEQIIDRETSMADARIALCVAEGIATDDIDPASGYSLSRESYESVRQTWRNHAKQFGWDECYRRDLDEVLAYWAARRPEFTEGDDWLADRNNKGTNQS